MCAKMQRVDEKEGRQFNLLPVVLRQVFLGFLEPRCVLIWHEVARNVRKDQAELETLFMINNEFPESNLCIPAKVRRVVVRGKQTPDLVQCASEYPFLHEVKFPTGSSCASLQEIAACQNLQTLDLSMFGVVTNQALAAVSTLPHLKNLYMSWCRIESDEAFEHVSRILSLERLKLQKTLISKDGLVLIATMPNLTSLNIAECYQIEDVDLEILENTKLRMLRLSDNDQFTDKGVMHVTRIASLEELSLNSIKITDLSLSKIAKLVNLRTLGLLDCNQITAGGITQLSTLTNLVRIYANFKPMTDDSLRYLACLSKLEKLDLSYCTHVTDTGVFHIVAGMKAITALDLTCCDVTDSAVLQLHLLPRLQTLLLRRCKDITDFSVASLVAIRSLKLINVFGCPKVTRNAFKHFPASIRWFC